MAALFRSSIHLSFSSREAALNAPPSLPSLRTTANEFEVSPVVGSECLNVAIPSLSPSS